MSMSNADKALVAAIVATAGQIEDVRTRDAITAAARGERAEKSDGIRQEVLSGKQAAKLLNVTTRTIESLARRGTIKRARLPDRTRAFGYLRTSVEELVAGGVA